MFIKRKIAKCTSSSSTRHQLYSPKHEVGKSVDFYTLVYSSSWLESELSMTRMRRYFRCLLKLNWELYVGDRFCCVDDGKLILSVQLFIMAPANICWNFVFSVLIDGFGGVSKLSRAGSGWTSVPIWDFLLTLLLSLRIWDICFCSLRSSPWS